MRKIKIVCTKAQKNIIYKALLTSDDCCFNSCHIEGCGDYKSCEECFKDNIEWEIKEIK